VSAERCPGCRLRLAEQPVCPRCGCDLTLVRRAEAQARRFVLRAVQAYALGEVRQARGFAREALKLEHSPLARALLRGLEPA
jgi:predicted amidophosphoribosyltransferase